MGSTGESGKRDEDEDEDRHRAERERMRRWEGSGFSLLESDGTDLQSTQKWVQHSAHMAPLRVVRHQ